MAVVMMGNGDEDKPMLRDFLGMSCGGPPPTAADAAGEKTTAAAAAATVEAEASAGVSSGGHGLVSASSDLGYERQGVNNSEVFHFHGRKHAMSGLEASNTFSGRKRSNSDSAYMGLVRDRMLPVGSDSPESSHLMKMSGKEVMDERSGRSNDEEMLFSMQLPPRPTSLILHQPVSSRPDLHVPKWERPLPVSPGGMLHHPSRFGQTGTYMDNLLSSYAKRDSGAGAALISQTAADEGSRTGIKGSGIMNIAIPSNRVAEKSSTAMLPSSRPRPPQTTEIESPSTPSCHNLSSVSRQMTIFYAGQAHVFDDVHPNKADVIMALAGSNGGSWSTTYNKSIVRPPASETKILGIEAEARMNKLPLVISGNIDRGLRQAPQVPVTSDLPSLVPGFHLGGRAIGEARSMNPSAEPDTKGKQNV